jgi:Zn-dependent M28 family amino/carboxypeptidase
LPDPVAQDRLLAHLHTLVGERHPVSSPAALQRAEAYLADTFTQLGLAVSTHPFEAPGGTYHNVVATLPPTHRGSGSPAPPVILAAHYDTVEGSPGADDNASALAVLLEVARRLSAVERRREIQCIGFCLEEEGLLGSLAYAGELKTARRVIGGALVLECVGYASSREGSQRVPPGLPIAVPTVGNFLAVIGNAASSALTAAVEQAARPHVPVVTLTVPVQGERLPDTRRSDHAAFWQHGFPAVMLTDTADFRNPNYHCASDTLNTLDLDFLGRVADAVTAALTVLAVRPSS